MTTDFDVIIVGSGPAGVSAAFPLVQAGRRVLMVDGGQHAALSPPKQSFLVGRTVDSEQWKWMIGKNFRSLSGLDSLSPKLRAPIHEYVFNDFQRANQIKTEHFIAVGSMAAGGLSNAWGCGVAKLSGEELASFPFDPSDIDQSYETIAKRIGISGQQDDDLSDYYGLDAWIQPPIQMDLLHTRLYQQYIKYKPYLASLGFRLGRSRVAALSQDLLERKACNRSSNCLWGCDRRSLYTAADELAVLQQYSNFHYMSGFVVDNLRKKGNDWLIEGVQESTRVNSSLGAHKIILAAGTLATTRIVLHAINLFKPVPLLSCPMAIFLLWLPRLLGVASTSTFSLGQLSFTFPLQNDIVAFGSSFSTTGLPVSDFVRHLPFRRRQGIDLLQHILSSCLVGNLFLPGYLSNNDVVINQDGFLTINGGYSEAVSDVMLTAQIKLQQAYKRLGARMLPNSFIVGKPGSDIHYAGTLPMRSQPKQGETTAFGEVYGLEGVHVVDGACLPTLSEKSHTLTIMANADRIGRFVAFNHLKTTKEY